MMSLTPSMDVDVDEYSCYPDWTALPDALKLNIFSYLDIRSLYQASLACRSWLQVAYDELLWKNFFHCHWKISRSVPLAPGKQSYVQEYKRLFYHTPSVESEVLKQHTDEVLHVSFSNSGEMFATSSKDGFIIVWNICFPTSCKYKADMKPWSWQYTLSSQFNSSDTLLMVSSGPVTSQGMPYAGEIAIFKLEEGFEMIKRVPNKPFDVGAWLNEFFFVSGDQKSVGTANYSVICVNQAYEVNPSEPANQNTKICTLRNRNIFAVSSVVVANCLHQNGNTEASIMYQSTNQSGELSTLESCEEVVHCEESGPYENDETLRNPSKRPFTDPEDVSEQEQPCFKLTRSRIRAANNRKSKTSADNALKQTSYAAAYTELKAIKNSANTDSEGNLSSMLPTDVCPVGDTDSKTHEKKNILVICDSKGNVIDNSKRVSNDNVTGNIDMNTQSTMTNDLLLEDKYLIFVTDGDAIVHHRLAIKRVSIPSNLSACLQPNATEIDNGPEGNGICNDKVDHIIDMHAHIIGMSLSPDQRYLYINSRPWPENFEITDPGNPPIEAKEIDIHIIDLTDLSRWKTMHKCHAGYTYNLNCFLIDLDVSDDYVARTNLSSKDTSGTGRIRPQSSFKNIKGKDGQTYLNKQQNYSGSEDCHGYMWDRHYGICLQKFPHEDVVSSIAFNPKDPEVLVTVSDDFDVKIWRSLNREKQIKSADKSQTRL